MWARLTNAMRVVFRRNRVERELDDELRFHVEMQTGENIRRGMPPAAARAAAAQSFGGYERIKEQCRDARGARFVEMLAQDTRFALRTLRASPGFALVAILTLGLGIGANTAIFSVIQGVLLKPLPYADPDRLVLVRQSAPGAGQAIVNLSIKEYFDYRAQSSSDFEALVEYHQMSFDLLKRGDPDRVSTGVVSHNFFDVLGIRPLIGRTFTAADDHPGAEAVLILSHSYWQTRFGGDPAIVGQVFQMNDRPHTVIGVLPDVPHYPAENDVYMPVLACPFRAAAERNIAQNRRAFGALVVFGRLREGITRERAAGGLEAICRRFVQENPGSYRAGSGFAATALDVRDELTRNARPLLLILMGTTVLVLLLACANVANLALARVLRRDRELALRTAVGAGRGRLIRQLLTESTILALAGGGVGLAFASATVDLLALFVARFTDRVGEIALDPRVLVFALAVSTLTGLVFGTVPALASRMDVVKALKQSGRSAGEGSGHRVQGGLIVVQVAVSVVLLVGAGLLLVSFYRLQRVDPGYRTDHVLSAEAFGNFTKYPTPEALLAFYLPLLERLEQQPGIVAAAVTNSVPLSGQVPGTTPFQIEGRPVDDPDRRPTADVRVASPRLFDTLGVPPLAGRVFTELDHREAPRVVVINQSMTRYWEATDPIGSRISADGGDTWATVVGVVSDIRQFGLDRQAVAQIYVPLRQTPFGLAGRVLVRTRDEPLAAAGALRAAIHAIDPDMPVENVQTLGALRDTYLTAPRLTATLLGIFAGLALFVTVTGIAGVIATTVSERTQEFGIRMALGAEPGGVLRMVLREGLTLVAIGLALGVAGALALTRLLASLLFEVDPADPVTFASVAVVLLAVAGAACFVPARRATHIAPMAALRST